MRSTPRRQRHPRPAARLRTGDEGTTRHCAPGPHRKSRLRRGVITTGHHLIPLTNWVLARIPIPDRAWRYFATCPYCNTIRRRRLDPCPECHL